MNHLTTLIFDVNDTLLDLSPLKQRVKNALGGKEELIPLWFSTLLHYSLVANQTDTYQDFGNIGVAALLLVAQTNDIKLSTEEAQDAVLQPFKELPPYADVIPGLSSLKESGFTLVALTNSSQKSLEEKLKFANIYHYFDHTFSSEPLKKFKPEIGVYTWTLNKLDIQPNEAMMVAAHGWDIMGAQHCKLHTCFVQRPHKHQFPLAKPADLSVPTVAALGDLL